MSHSDLRISDYALIGNGQTAALVSRSGSVDWCCWPRFDSPAVFCRLLDVDQGGFFRVEPADGYRVTWSCARSSNVLETTFSTTQGVVRLTDLMPAPDDEAGHRTFPHRILRKVECLDGQAAINVVFRPTFDYARVRPRFVLHPHGGIAYGDGEALTLACPVHLEGRADSLVGRKLLSAGEQFWLVLTHGSAPDAQQQLELKDQANAEYHRTIDYWQRWSDKCGYDGPYRELVIRSALMLKLLVFQPTGALVAAPTTSLPGEIGGVRNCAL